MLVEVWQNCRLAKKKLKEILVFINNIYFVANILSYKTQSFFSVANAKKPLFFSTYTEDYISTKNTHTHTLN